AGAAVLAWEDGFRLAELAGPLLIAAACLAWAFDNNLTRKVALGDPVQITMIKGLAAGAINLTLAIAVGARLPAPGPALAAGVLGFAGYGISLVLFVFA